MSLNIQNNNNNNHSRFSNLRQVENFDGTFGDSIGSLPATSQEVVSVPAYFIACCIFNFKNSRSKVTLLNLMQEGLIYNRKNNRCTNCFDLSVKIEINICFGVLDEVFVFLLFFISYPLLRSCFIFSTFFFLSAFRARPYQPEQPTIASFVSSYPKIIYEPS